MLCAEDCRYDINEYIKHRAELFSVQLERQCPGHTNTHLHQDSLGDARTESWQLENRPRGANPIIPSGLRVCLPPPGCSNARNLLMGKREGTIHMELSLVNVLAV